MSNYDGYNIQFLNNTRYVIKITEPFYTSHSDNIVSFTQAEMLLTNLNYIDWVTDSNGCGYFQIQAGSTVTDPLQISTATISSISINRTYGGMGGCDSDNNLVTFTFMNILQRGGMNCDTTTPYDMQVVFIDPDSGNESRPIQISFVQQNSGSPLEINDFQYAYLPELSVPASSEFNYANPLIQTQVSISSKLVSVVFSEVTVPFPANTGAFICHDEKSDEYNSCSNLPFVSAIGQLTPCYLPNAPVRGYCAAGVACYPGVGCSYPAVWPPAKK